MKLKIRETSLQLSSIYTLILRCFLDLKLFSIWSQTFKDFVNIQWLFHSNFSILHRFLAWSTNKLMVSYNIRWKTLTN